MIEPFAGSAAITLAAAAANLAANFVINDFNRPLIQLWQAIINTPEKLARQYETLWRQQHGDRRRFYDRVRDEFNRTGRPDHLLYLLARCVKASVRYNAAAEFNQSPDNRPKTVIDHILQYGFITTQELKDKYGYNHPPRAVRDVKEHGIPIEMFRVEGSDGRKIAAYRFGDPTKFRIGQQTGRMAFSQEIRQKLVALHGARCAIYLGLSRQLHSHRHAPDSAGGCYVDGTRGQDL